MQGGTRMALNFFDKSYIKSHGISNKVICPDCKKTVEMGLFETLDVSAVAIFLEKEMSEYFSVCPSCSGIFSVNPMFMKEKEKGTFCILTADDLTPLKGTDGSI